MKAQVKTEELINAVGSAKAAVSSRSTLPILSCVLLTARDGKLIVTGSNLETFVLATCKAKITSSGMACVPAGNMLDSLKALSEQSAVVELSIKRTKTEVPLTFEEREALKASGKPENEIPHTKPGWKSEFLIEAGKAWAVLPFKDPKDYPHIPEVKAKSTVFFRNLVDSIKEVDYAMSSEQSRPVLNGISMKQANGRIAIAAADGFRLAIKLLKTRGKIPSEIVIPAGAAALIKKLMPDETRLDIMPYKRPCVQTGETRTELHLLSFRPKKGNLEILSYVVDGTYPEYEKLVPKTSKKITVARAAMEKALKFMATLKSAEGVHLQKKAGELVISRKGYEHELATRIPAAGSINIGADVNYLTDLVKHLDDQITLRWKDSVSPLLVKRGTTTHVLMPMHIKAN